MGSWNGTCGLTELPIISGTDIFVFPIVESYRDSFCYSSALYRSSVLSFRAKYNDYGAGENCTGVALPHLIEGIREQLVELEVGENQYHDIAVKREGFDVDMFFEACHEKRLMFTNPLRGYEGQSKTKDVFFTMIRKDAVDRLWNEWTFDMYKRKEVPIPDGFETDKYYFKNVTYAKLAELIPEYMAVCASELKEFTSIQPKDNLSEEELAKFKRAVASIKYRGFFGPRFSHILGDIFGHAFGDGYSDGGFANIADVRDTIIVEYMEGDKEVAYALMREAMIGSMVNSFMESTRKVWLPVMHQGSQSEEYAEYKLLNKITADIIKEREREYDEDYEEEDEENV
jgi:hypothetical protein